jgi:hypothetical protein
MRQLPGATNASVPDDKSRYLLDPAHSLEAAGKSKFFTSLGFSDWAALKKALLEHPQVNQAGPPINTGYGDKYVVSCSLTTPDGRNPCIVSVWIIEPPDPNPRLITAYPNP